MLARSDDLITTIADRSSRGPRYTSYPPATEFGPIAIARVHRELARIAEASAAVSLYVHVPFCRSLCAYCACNVVPTRDGSRGPRYLDHLATEMALIGRHLDAAPVTEIAIGGGSPNFLAPDALRTLSWSLDRYFAVAPDARRSIELDPRATTIDQIDAVAALGFRSLSLGVQDFSASVQDAIRRHQTVAETRRLVACAREAGFDDINIDIVYGLPRQTEVSFARTLEQVISLQPDRVALFGYAHLPSKHPQQHLVERGGRVLDRYERAALLLLALETFEAAGYVHLGLDHFARPGSSLARAAAEHRMIRTFQGFVERRADAILGIGASAISSTRHAHWQNHFDLATWERAISTLALPVDRGFELSDDDRARAAVIDRLMCEGEVDLGWIGRAHGVDPEDYFAEELAALGEITDLATYDRDDRVVRTTPLGRLLVRNVCMVFDRYHRSSDGSRHSYTV